MAPLATDAAAISARLDRLPATRSVWVLVVLLSFGLFFELYDLLFTAYVAPALVASGILKTAAGFIASLFSGLFIATLICGFLADKYGRRTIFTYSLLWYTASTLIMAFQNTAFGLNFWRFMAGLGIGVEIVTIGTYLTELVPKHIRGRAFAVSQTVGFSAVPVVAFLSYLLVPKTLFGLEGWRWVVLLGAHGAVFVWWIRRRLPESPRWLAQQGRFEEAATIMCGLEGRVHAEFGAPLPNPAEVPQVAVRRAAFAEMWIPPYRRRTIMLTIFHIFQTIGYYGFANWVPTLLIKQGITITNSLLYTSIIAIAAPLGPLIGFFIADRFERKSVIVGMAGVNVLCGLIFSQVTERLWIIAMGVCLTLAGNIISYNFHLYQQELFPTAIRSRAAGFVYSWSRISAIFNAFIIEFFLSRFGVTGVFVFIAAAMTVVMATIGRMGPRTKGLALEQLSR